MVWQNLIAMIAHCNNITLFNNSEIIQVHSVQHQDDSFIANNVFNPLDQPRNHLSSVLCNSQEVKAWSKPTRDQDVDNPHHISVGRITS